MIVSAGWVVCAEEENCVDDDNDDEDDDDDVDWPTQRLLSSRFLCLKWWILSGESLEGEKKYLSEEEKDEEWVVGGLSGCGGRRNDFW